jgi:outer membrane protein OmpA-like peptidoglycan-associated protein
MIRLKRNVIAILFAAFALALVGYTQDAGMRSATTQPLTLKVPVGQIMHIEGVIVNQENERLFIRDTGGGLYMVNLAGAELKEKKSNPFRGAKKYSKTDLLQGLHVDVKGAGDTSGAITASEVRFKSDDFKLAQTMDVRVVPVEDRLKNTQDRLNETEQNAQRLSGQVRELSAITDIVRDSAKAAQASADGAMTEARGARSSADNANVGVQAANERIGALDTYEAKNVAMINFKAGSAVLAQEEREKLDKFAENAKSEKGFMIEVTGFASSDGDENYNRRLSQHRADSVIQYLAENYAIPLRRFILPMGYGEKQPIADNTTLAGRKENRRVEVRILVSKGLASRENLPPDTGVKLSAN